MKLRMLVVLLSLLSIVTSETYAQSTIVSDDFNSPVLNLEVWSFINPAGHASLTMAGAGSGKAHANIHVQATGSGEGSLSPYRFPRVMQRANNANVELEVKFEGTLEGLGTGEGVVIEQDSTRFIKVTYTRQTTGVRLTAQTWKAGTPNLFYETAVGNSVIRFLKIRRTGENWDLFWSLDGINWTHGATTGFPLTLQAAGFFAENTGGNIFTSSVDYFFNTQQRIEPEDLYFGPLILVQPRDANLLPGGTAAFNVVADAPMPLRYQWYRNGVLVSQGTGPTLLVHSVSATDSGSRFVCSVWNEYGGTLTDTATLHIRALAPSIVSQPRDTAAAVGQTAFFSITASGTPPLSYQWQKNSVNIPGANSSSYTTPATVMADSGALFRCVVTNSAGTAISNNAVLRVMPLAPSIISQPRDTAVTVGQTAFFSITASGTPPLSYQWQKNSVNIPGANSSSYTTPATVMADSGALFRCVVTNSAGTVISNNAVLRVMPLAPSIVSQPRDTAVTVGQSAFFSITASGTPPLSYQWQKNSVNIPGATSSSYTTPATAMADSGALFRCVVTNSAGTVISNNAVLRVMPLAPSIVSQPRDTAVTVGQSAFFSITASGTPPLSYQWQKNSVNIPGATSSSYTTPATAMADSGALFRCVVTNSAGTAISNNAVLRVMPLAPSIVSQPRDTAVTVGQTAFFSITASGTPPLSYQWQKNSVNIPGANASSYTTPATVMADSGALFRCVVTNSAGTVISNNAVLRVMPLAPTIISQPRDTAVAVGQTAFFSISASGTPPLAYQWQKNSINIPGASSSSYTTPATAMADSGALFRCVVTNSAGSSVSTAALLRVLPSQSAPVITVHPRGRRVAPGQRHKLEVTATGQAPLSYQWQRNGISITGANQNSYVTPQLTLGDNNTHYRCIVSNNGGTVTSDTAWVRVVNADAPGARVPFRYVLIDRNNPRHPHTTSVGDINLDGFPDIVNASGDGFRDGIFWYRYPEWTKTRIDTGSFSTDQQLGDIDGDGDLDLVIPRGIDLGVSVWWYENPLPHGNPATTPWTRHFIGNALAHDVELHDFDQDGRMDVLVRYNTLTIFFQEPGNQWRSVIISQRQREGTAVGDIDGDGDLDLLINGYWLRNPLPNGNPRTDPWTEYLVDTNWPVDVSAQIADINGDGRNDLLLAPSGGFAGRLAWYESANPLTGPWVQRIIKQFTECIHGFKIADFDHDGDKDIVAAEGHYCNDPDNISVFLNEGGALSWHEQIIATTGLHNLRITDISADGDFDVVGSNAHDVVNQHGSPLEMWENLMGFTFSAGLLPGVDPDPKPRITPASRVVRDRDARPVEMALYQNYPNPFNPLTTIQFDLPKAGRVTLRLYSTLGQEVMVLLDEEKEEGRYSVQVYAATLPSGVYFYRLNAGGVIMTRKLTLLK